MIKKIDSTQIYQDAWLKFYQDKIQHEDGTTGTYAWIDRKHGVLIAVVDSENRLLLNKEHRYVVSGYSWEIPGGGIDQGEAPHAAALRELREETGIEAAELEQLGVLHPLNSISTETVTVFFLPSTKPDCLVSTRRGRGKYCRTTLVHC